MIVLTGGAGFIGSALLSKLNQEGVEDIYVVDNLGSSDKWKNLNGKKFDDYIHKDKFLTRLQEGSFKGKIQAIVHLGACTSTLERNAEYMIQNNYDYSLFLAEWAISNRARFIYASSGATYGDGSEGFSDDDEVTVRLRPLNVYGFSKQLFDLWALRSKAVGRIAGLKFFNVFGPNEYHKGEMASVIYKAYHQIKDTGSLGLFKSYNPDYKDGEQERDFVYVKDCVEVLWWLLVNHNVNGIFNVGTEKARTWNDLAAAIFKALEREPSIKYIEMPEGMRQGYQYFTEADMSKLRKAGFKTEFRSLEDAVSDYVKNYLLQNEARI